MGKFSISLYMFFSFSTATDASSNLVGKTRKWGMRNRYCLRFVLVASEYLNTFEPSACKPLFMGQISESYWNTGLWISPSPCSEHKHLIKQDSYNPVLHYTTSHVAALSSASFHIYLYLFTFLTWPGVWRLSPASPLPGAGGPHSTERGNMDVYQRNKIKTTS